MSSRSFESRFAAIKALKTVAAAEAIPLLGRALQSKTALIVHEAARVAADRDFTTLLPEVEAALDRFFALPAKKDLGCLAKLALVEACDQLGSVETRLFQAALRWPGMDQRAAEVRVRGLVALLRLDYAAAMREAARLLADRSPTARIGAARALGQASPASGAPLLRFKALTGDSESVVMEAVFDSLLALEPGPSASFVAEFLSSQDDTISDIAALALGESRLPEACDPLIALAERVPAGRVEIPFLALAMLRDPRSMDYLVLQVGESTSERAIAAVQALAPFAAHPDLAARVREASVTRKAVYSEYQRRFGTE